MNTRYSNSSRGISPFGQFGIFIGLLGLGFILAGVVTIAVITLMLNVPLMQVPAAILDPKNIQAARLLQTVSTLALFAVPAVLFAVIVNRRPVSYLGLTNPANARQFYIVVLIAIAALFAQSALSYLNEIIPISKHLEEVFKKQEAEYSREVLAMAQMKNMGDFVMALFILALLPAVFEELFFRGALQQMLINLFRNAFWGILITSILFSAAHFSYYGFLTRMFLGIVLGYIFYYSKNIWLNITVHFLNNAVVVTGLYSLSLKGQLTEKSLNDEGDYPVYVGLLAIIAIFALFTFFKRESVKTVLVTNDGITDEYQITTEENKSNGDVS